MLDASQIRTILEAEMADLSFEVTTLARVFGETRFFEHPNNFPNAHFGYLMACMGKLDALSSYWSGRVGSKGQTDRMVSFMDRYLHPDRPDENRLAVQMFRHTLMHTGALRFIYDRGADVRYTWRVYLGEGLRPEWHYRITAEDERYQDQLRSFSVSTGSTDSRCMGLNVSIPRFVEDLGSALQRYLADLDSDMSLQSNFNQSHPQIAIQEFG